jgi:protein-L-isoaspartate(D-aspartate) O-methyltransferase
MEFESLRQWMVETQIISRGVKNKEVIRAMLKVPRHRFVPEEFIEKAYDDMALPIGEGQTISQPYMVAVMTELLEPEYKNKVLEIGTGSGYQAAVLAEIVKEVYTVERLASLSERAKQRVRELGYENIFLRLEMVPLAGLRSHLLIESLSLLERQKSLIHLLASLLKME